MPQPTSSTRRPRIAVEVDQPKQVVQLLEVVLVEIGEEARRAHRVVRDLEIVDVMVPVAADLGGRRAAAGPVRHGRYYRILMTFRQCARRGTS